MISKYIRLIRPATWLAFLPPFTVGFALGVDSSSYLLSAIYAFAAFAFGMSFSMSVNALHDKDTDRFQSKKSKDSDLADQPIVTGEITEKRGLFLSILFLILSLLFSWLVNIQFFLLSLLLIAVSTTYSMSPMRFKTRPVGDILCNTLAGGLVFVAGLSIGGNNMFPILLLVGFGSPPIYYIPTVVWDYKIDKKAGLKTSAVFFGPERLMKARYPFVIITLLIYLFIVLNYDFELQVISLSVILSVIVAVFVQNKKMKNEEVLTSLNPIFNVMILKSVVFIVYGVLKIYNIFTL
jgi:4-hydroxybenzoate polyprenyltransferase